MRCPHAAGKFFKMWGAAIQCHRNPSNAANSGLCNLHVLVQILCRCPQHQSRKALDTQHVASIVEWPTPCILAAPRNRSPRYLVASTLFYRTVGKTWKDFVLQLFLPKTGKDIVKPSHPAPRMIRLIRHGITWPEIPLGTSILKRNALDIL